MLQHKYINIQWCLLCSVLFLLGADKVSNYQQLLRLVQYVHNKPQDLKHRVFSLTCTEVNQHLVSNPMHVNVCCGLEGCNIRVGENKFVCVTSDFINTVSILKMYEHKYSFALCYIIV